MMTDKMIDEALVEVARTMKSLQALRAKRKSFDERTDQWLPREQSKEHAYAMRATLDLTHKLAQLRRGD